MNRREKSLNSDPHHMEPMHPRMLISTLLILAACGVPLASAAGTGTFTISDAAALVGQNGMTTLALNTSWEPPASDIWLTIRYDPAIIRYEGTRFTAGGTASATRTQAGTVLVQIVDTAGVYRSGPLAAIMFSGLKNGSSALEIELQHVRSYPDGRPVEITDTASTVPGVFAVLASAPANVTATPAGMPNRTPADTFPPAPTTTMPPSLPTLPPATAGTPSLPSTTVLHGDDYTGAVSPTATAAPVGTTPASNRTIAEIAAANPEFSVFVNATQAAGLFDVLNGPGPLTAFIPTNAVFDAMPQGALEALLANRTALELLLRYHLAPGTLTVADVTARASVPTLLGVPFSVAVRPGGALGVDGANLTLLDIPAANGMIHIVDGVLAPPGMSLVPVATAPPAPTATPITMPPSAPASTTRVGSGIPLMAIVALAVSALLCMRPGQ